MHHRRPASELGRGGHLRLLNRPIRVGLWAELFARCLGAREDLATRSILWPMAGGMRTIATYGWVLVAFASSACDDPPCEQLKQHLEDCNLTAKVDFCDRDEDQCRADCFLPLSCQELLAPKTKARLCLLSCASKVECDKGETTIPNWWQCDGEFDCLDHSDESKCP